MTRYDFLEARRIIMTRYDFVEARRIILSYVRIDFQTLVNCACELGQIMTRYDFLGARQVMLSNYVRSKSNLT